MKPPFDNDGNDLLDEYGLSETQAKNFLINDKDFVFGDQELMHAVFDTKTPEQQKIIKSIWKNKNPIRDCQLDFGPENLKPNETKTITVYPNCTFRGEKFIAAESAPGATYVISIVVAGKPQNSYPKLTKYLGNASLTSGIKWDICKNTEPVIVLVRNLTNKSVTWEGAVFGKMIL